jgi:hypothetical protein
MLQPKIIDVEAFSNYKLKLHYETGEKKLFDVSPYICGNWYGQLKELAYFNTVHVLPDGGGIEWAEGQDIAPHELYNTSVEIRENNLE